MRLRTDFHVISNKSRVGLHQVNSGMNALRYHAIIAHLIIPTKTPFIVVQSSGREPSSRSVPCHVFRTSDFCVSVDQTGQIRLGPSSPSRTLANPE